MGTKETAHEVKRRRKTLATDPRLAWLARIGYVARGIVYFIVGILAALAALGRGGETTGSRGALRTLLGDPLERVLLTGLGVGMLAFAVWGAVQAIADPERQGHSIMGLILRTAAGTGAIAYTLLGVYALSIAFGGAYGGAGGDPSSGGKDVRSWSAWLIGKPAGQLALALVGLVVFGVGISQVVIGWIGAYRGWLAMDQQKMKWADPICKFGLIARGGVFILVGVFVIVAAYRKDPGDARGFGGALRFLEVGPHGEVFLLAAALGLIAFGAYSFIVAVYGRIGPPLSDQPDH